MTKLKKRGIVAEDLYKIKFISDPQISPNGEEVLYSLTTINADKEYTSQIWLIDNQGKLLQFTNTDKVDSSPCWSPDGEQIAFVSNRGGDKQIWLVSRNGGEAKQLTHLYNGASDPVWSPDGKKIVFLSRVGLNDEMEKLLIEKTNEDREKEKKEKGQKVKVIDELRYKSDGMGFSDQKRSQIWVIDVENGTVEKLTEQYRNYSRPTWSPEGDKLALTCEVHEPEYNPGMSELLILDLKSKELKNLIPTSFSISSPTWAPDGDKIAFYGHKGEYKGATLNKIWIIDIASGSLSALLADQDICIGDYCMSDLRAGGTDPGPQWSSDGQYLYTIISQNGSSYLSQIGLNGSISKIIDNKRQTFGFSIDQKRNKAAIVFTTPIIPGDIALVDLQHKEEKVLTNINEKLLQELNLSTPEEFVFEGADGWMIQGWMMKPVNFKDSEKYPLILEVHGGPHAMYSTSFFHEFQLLAARGNGVVFCNPRGSQGYGQKFVDAVRGDYGGKDYEDIMACVDYMLVNCDWVDQDRLGVTGGSYGGFMTNWIVTHTDRFKAAVTQRSISNWISFAGVSDIGYFFAEWEHSLNFMKDWDDLISISPIADADKITTPLLIIHSEHDFRCPLEQAEQFFIYLKYLKKTVRLSIFPGSNHNLSRNGKPELRVERLNQIADWFDQYL